MQTILEKIDGLKHALDRLLPMSGNAQQQLDKKFRLEFNFNSNHLEGNTLTYGETELLLIFDQTKGEHTGREYEEMKAHDACLALIKQWTTDPRPLAEADIKNLNKLLLVKPYWKDAVTPDGQPTRRQITVGEYKQHPNSVRLANGELFEYASPLETPAKMEELVAWLAREEQASNAHPLLLAALLHYRFVRIHPFDDGNGRVSRLLMNYVLLKHGFPMVVIKSADKAKYLSALNQADAGDEAAFVQYIGEQLIWSLELSIKAAKGEPIEEPDDLDKVLAVLQKQLSSKSEEQFKSPENVVFAFDNGLITAFKEIEKKLSVIAGNFSSVVKIFEIGSDTNHEDLSELESFQEWLQTEVKGANLQVSQIVYRHRLNRLKQFPDGGSFEARVSITFNPFVFAVNGITFPYGKPLSQDQITEIVHPVVKDVVEQIKNIKGL